MAKGTNRKESSQFQAWDNHADGWRLSGSTEAHVDNRTDLRGKLNPNAKSAERQPKSGIHLTLTVLNVFLKCCSLEYTLITFLTY